MLEVALALLIAGHGMHYLIEGHSMMLAPNV